MPSDYQKVFPSLIQNENTILQPLSDTTYAGYTLIKDIYGRPIVILRTETERDIYREGQYATSYLMISLVIVGLVFAAGTIFLMERQVLLPLTRLAKNISNIRISGDISERIPVNGNDELANLGNTINSMLTALQQSESSLLESEGRFRDILDQASDGIVIVRDKTIKYTNPYIRKMVGYPEKSDMTGVSITSYIWPSELTRVMQDYQKHLSGNAVQTPYETILKHRNGTPIYVECTVRVAPYQGTLAEFVYIRDISANKRAKQELEMRSELLDAVLDIVILCDHSGKIFYINKKAVDLIGYNIEKLLTMSLMELLPAEEQQLLPQNNSSLREKGEIVLETRLKTEGGDIIPVEIFARLIELSNKSFILVIIRDTTIHKNAQEALQMEKENYRNSLDNAPLPTTIVDDNEEILYANKAMLQFYQINSLTELQQIPAIQRYTAQSYNQFLKRKTDRLAGKETTSNFEIDLIRKDGSVKHMMVYRKTIIWDGKKEYQNIYQDFTERSQNEKQLRQSFDKQIELSKTLADNIQRQEQFYRALVHELKTPLTSIISSSNLIASELKEEPWLSLSNNILRSANHLNSRINELYDLARSETNALQLDLQLLDPVLLIKTIVDEMHPLFSDRKQVLALDMPESLPYIKADSDRLRQVIYNLLDNASKFTPEGGRITIKAIEKDDSLTVSVHDSGVGISKENQKNLFTPYYRSEGPRERASGLGLGLSICKTFIELHGGKIWVNSQEGKGSTFSFSIPIEKKPRE